MRRIGLYALVGLLLVVTGFNALSFLLMREQVDSLKSSIASLQLSMQDQISSAHDDIKRFSGTQAEHSSKLKTLSDGLRAITSEQTAGATGQSEVLALGDQGEAEQSDRPLTPTELLADEIRRSEEREEARRTLLQTNFEQLPDDAWSTQAFSNLYQVLNSEGVTSLGLTIESSECRSSMCRVVIVHTSSPDDEMAVSFTVPSLVGHQTPRMASTSEILPGGKRRTVMYLATQNTRFPSPDNPG